MNSVIKTNKTKRENKQRKEFLFLLRVSLFFRLCIGLNLKLLDHHLLTVFMIHSLFSFNSTTIQGVLKLHRSVTGTYVFYK